MASISAWMDTEAAEGSRGQASKVSGGQVREFAMTYEKLGAADGDGSVLGIALLPANAVLTKLELNNDSLSGCTSASVGYYKYDIATHAFVDTAVSGGTSGKAVLLSAADINAGKAIGSEQNAMSAVVMENLPKKIWEHLSFSDPGKADTNYALCLTLTTAGTAAGTITVRGRYILG